MGRINRPIPEHELWKHLEPGSKWGMDFTDQVVVHSIGKEGKRFAPVAYAAHQRHGMMLTDLIQATMVAMEEVYKDAGQGSKDERGDLPRADSERAGS